MKKSIKNIVTIVRERKNLSILKTYNSGLLQAKAYRLLKRYISVNLKKHGLTTVEWAMLGQLYETTSLTITQTANILDVEKPFATNLTEVLRKKGFVTRIVDKEDRRSKKISLTEKGRVQVPVIEKDLRSAMSTILNNVSADDIFSYIKVLEEIVRNTSTRK